MALYPEPRERLCEYLPRPNNSANTAQRLTGTADSQTVPVSLGAFSGIPDRLSLTCQANDAEAILLDDVGRELVRIWLHPEETQSTDVRCRTVQVLKVDAGANPRVDAVGYWLEPRARPVPVHDVAEPAPAG